MRYEYKLIPAPAEAPKVKGLKGATARYVHALEEVLNAMGAAGWEYVRCERMHVTASRGWLRRPEERDETLLVFRRERAAARPGPEAEDADEDEDIPAYMRPQLARRDEAAPGPVPGPDRPTLARPPLAARRD